MEDIEQRKEHLYNGLAGLFMVKEAAMAPFKVKGRLKIPAPSKWLRAPRTKNPKTSKPSKPIEQTPKQNPPSKEKYYTDLLKRLQDQRYGTRTIL